MLPLVLICVAASAVFVILFLLEIAPGRNPLAAQRLNELRPKRNLPQPNTIQQRLHAMHERHDRIEPEEPRRSLDRVSAPENQVDRLVGRSTARTLK